MKTSPIPPFPSNVNTAPLLSISLSKLLAHDVVEEDRLWDAACSLGFFYLDVIPNSNSSQGSDSSSQGQGILHEVDELFDIGKSIFEVDEETKKAFDYKERGSYFGYKPLGQGIIDAKGNRDANEFFNVSKDAVLQVLNSSEPVLPTLPVVEARHDVVNSFMRKAHAVAVDVVLGVLGKKLGVDLNEMHRLMEPSGDQVRFVRAPPLSAEKRNEQKDRPLLGAHTDFGSVTVLFAKVGGLQVFVPDSLAGGESMNVSPTYRSNTTSEKDGSWAYVKPVDGHAVINIGDALVHFSAGILQSALHRVISAPGDQSESTKYSVVYFCRPEDRVILQPLKQSELVSQRIETGRWHENEEGITAREWTLRRALGRRGMRKWEDSTGTEICKS